MSGYLLSSQGDRMLMANSVEGRFPFLDSDVVEFCNALPASYKLNILDEKHILKRVARGNIPQEIINRKKQAYRAPDAISFMGPKPCDYVEELFSKKALSASGLFDEKAVHRLYDKCLSHVGEKGEDVLFSNVDNMAFVGILSTQLLHNDFVSNYIPPDGREIVFKTAVDQKDEHAKG
jgi:asparagine synthase (glutamine-hydrolysing)